MPLFAVKANAQNAPVGISRQLPVVVVIFMLAVCGIGIASYQSFKKQIAFDATSTLESVAILRVGQIEAWLNEAKTDALLTVNGETFLADLVTWTRKGKHANKERDDLVDELRELRNVGQFRSVSLFDTDGTLLMTTDPANPPETNLSSIKATVTSGDWIVDDLRLNTKARTNDVNFGLLYPIPGVSRDKPTAVLVLSLNPVSKLYPLLQRWPGSSPSAETELLSRQGDQVVFLNALRHRADSALKLTVPASTPDLLEAKALGDLTGAFTGVDYRSVPSLAFRMPVPGSTWHIVTKIDENEVFGTLNSVASISVVLLGLLMALAGWWSINYYRNVAARFNAQAERLVLSDRINMLVKHANDCIFLIDADNRIVDVNDRCLMTYGYTREEMLEMHADQLMADDQRTGNPPESSDARRHFRDGQLLFATRHRRKDGSAFPVEVSRVSLLIGGVRQTQKIVRDISEREASFANIARLSQMYATLSVVNRAVARSDSIDLTLQAACRACVERGGLLVTWIALANADGESLSIAQCSGPDVENLIGTRISIGADSRDGRSPTALAFREQHPVICNDVADDPTIRPWQDQDGHERIYSLISLPIVQGGSTIGVLNAYSDKANFFGTQIESLLQEVVDSLSFAFQHFANTAEKAQVETNLRESEELLREAQEIARIGHWQHELGSETTFWSQEMYRLFEREPRSGPLKFQDIGDFYSPEMETLARKAVSDAIATQRRIDLELTLALSGNRVAYHAVTIIPLPDENGAVSLLRGTVQDITERKLTILRLEDVTDAMRLYANEVEDLYQNAPCGYHSLDRNGVFRRINETALKWLGYSREEIVGKVKIQDLLSPEYAAIFTKEFERLRRVGQINDIDAELICKDGRRLPVLINASVNYDDQGGFLLTRSVMYDMTERRKMELERLDYSKRLEQLSHRLVTAQEKGRRDLSAALHDQTSPNLAALEINLNVLAKSVADNNLAAISDMLADAKALLKDTTIGIREICSELRPPLLDYAGLVAALEGYARQFTRRTGTTVRVNCSGSQQRLLPEQESLLFRVAQEAMTNCAKHAEAETIEVTLSQTQDTTILTIVDDGVGFDSEQMWAGDNTIGQGILNMREMTEFLEGKFFIHSQPGNGTTITIEM